MRFGKEKRREEMDLAKRFRFWWLAHENVVFGGKKEREES
jgi:hypothetical protein